MRILCYGGLHHKNKQGLDLVSKHIPVIYLNTLEGVENYDDGKTILIISDNICEINFSKILYGPQIDLRDIINKSKKINNIKVNVLSKWIVDICKDFVVKDDIDFLTIPFPVNTEKFIPQNKENKCFLYFKHLEPYKLEIGKNIINNNLMLKDFEVKIFSYGSYNEDEYLNFINKSKFGIWIGGHESQGFALQEALSCDCPLFILNAQSMKDEFIHNYYYPWRNTEISDHELKATSVPYFDEKCGIISNYTNCNSDFLLFFENLKLYKPRDYVLNNLNVDQFIFKLCKEFNLSTPYHSP